MSGWFWLAFILLLFILLLASRLKLRLEYNEDGLQVEASIGLITVYRFPASRPKIAKTAAKKTKKEEEKPKETKKGGKMPDIREIISIITDTLGKLRRKLRMDELVLWYCSASSDPASAALAFGGASAAVGLLITPLEAAFRIQKRDIRTTVSFTETQPTVVLKLRISITLFSLLLGMALPAVIRFIWAMWDRKR